MKTASVEQKIFDSEYQIEFNKNLIAACGLFCGSCGIYLASKENDTERLLHYAIVLNQSLEETYCEGCGSEKKSAHCLKNCIFIKCQLEKGVSLCCNCKEFFCDKLETFRQKMPHRVEIEQSQKLLLSTDWKNWLIFQNDRFRCINCNTINSAYHIWCRNCGNTPSCKFIEEHNETIETYLID